MSAITVPRPVQDANTDPPRTTSPGRPGPYRRAPPVRKATAADPRRAVRVQRCSRPRETVQAPPMPEELLAALPRWSSRENYLLVVHELAKLPEVETACRKRGVALSTWLLVVINDAIDADTETGHNMTTCQETAGIRIGRKPKQVQRARNVSQDLGIMVETYRGYSLSRDQRLALVAIDPLHPQRGVPNAYAMVLCPPRQRAKIARIPSKTANVFAEVYTDVHLPTLGGVGSLPHLLETVTITPANAVDSTETAPPPRPKRKRCPGTALAHELLACPGLTMFQDTPAGRLAPQLGAHQAGGWHGLTLGQALLDEATRQGIWTTKPSVKAWCTLKVLLSSIDPIYDVYATAGTPSPPAQPCGIAPCDGHGWINLPGAAAKCPHCPPSVRSAPQSAAGDGWTGADPLSDEPPF